jgi:DNA-binding NarL/FixJ family response regulator
MNVYTPNSLNVAVIEDNRLLSEKFASIIASWDAIKNCSVFSSNREFINSCSDRNYDLALVDINLLDGTGFRSLNHIRDHHKSCQAIVISALSDGETVVNAIVAGAIGYLHKDDSSLGILSAIKMTLEGYSPISPSIARHIFKVVQRQEIEPSQSSMADPEISLTPKETEVLTYISKGLSYADVAAVLHMSPNTVPVHIRNIYRKLQVNNKIEAVNEARAHGYLL